LNVIQQRCQFGLRVCGAALVINDEFGQSCPAIWHWFPSRWARRISRLVFFGADAYCLMFVSYRLTLDTFCLEWVIHRPKQDKNFNHEDTKTTKQQELSF
jgi:hypothetical protein